MSEMERDERLRRIKMYVGDDQKFAKAGEFIIQFTPEEQNKLFAALLNGDHQDDDSKLGRILKMRQVLEALAQRRGFEDELGEMFVVESLAAAIRQEIDNKKKV